jgi:hypothetical protein
MKTNGNKRVLESHKIFPFVAWGLTIGFSFFVYNITSDLKDITLDLQQQTQVLQEQVNTPVNEIEDFDA